MTSVSGRWFAKAIERHGWVLFHVSGSHHIYGRMNGVERLSIPIRANALLKIGLLAYFMKLTDLEENALD